MSVPTHCMLASVQRSTSVRMKLYAMWALSSQYPLAVASQYIYIPPIRPQFVVLLYHQELSLKYMSVGSYYTSPQL